MTFLAMLIKTLAQGPMLQKRGFPCTLWAVKGSAWYLRLNAKLPHFFLQCILWVHIIMSPTHPIP